MSAFAWMLDDGPLGVLAMCALPTWVWRPRSLHVSEAVAKGAARDRSGRRQYLLGLTVQGMAVVETHEVRPGSESERCLYGHLRRNSALAMNDLGEDESIALLATGELDAVFVVSDRRACTIALAELGRCRVAAPFELWRWLKSEGVVDDAGFRALCDRTLKQDQGLPGLPYRWSLP